MIREKLWFYSISTRIKRNFFHSYYNWQYRRILLKLKADKILYALIEFVSKKVLCNISTYVLSLKLIHNEICILCTILFTWLRIHENTFFYSISLLNLITERSYEYAIFLCIHAQIIFLFIGIIKYSYLNQRYIVATNGAKRWSILVYFKCNA